MHLQLHNHWDGKRCDKQVEDTINDATSQSQFSFIHTLATCWEYPVSRNGAEERLLASSLTCMRDVEDNLPALKNSEENKRHKDHSIEYASCMKDPSIRFQTSIVYYAIIEAEK
jgi:hypothetical protein